MKNKKILLFVALIYVTNLHAYDFCLDGIYYNIKNNNTLEVSSTIGGELSTSDFYSYKSGTKKRNDYSGKIVIPNTLMYNDINYKVVSIENYAFFKTSITSIEICANIEKIGNYALATPNLKEVKWSAKNCNFDYRNIFEIGTSILMGRSYITSFTFGDSCETIPNGLCYNMTGFTTLTIGKNVKSIGEQAFYGCTKLEEIVIPENVESIGYQAFQNCKFSSVIFAPNSKLTSIDTQAFYSCINLNEIHIPNSVTSIAYQSFCSCKNLSRILLGEQISSIGGMAFAFTAISSIELPASLRELGAGSGQVFEGTNLDTIKSYCIEPPKTVSTTFYGVDSTVHVFVPECTINEYKNRWTRFSNYETISGICTTVSGISLSPSIVSLNKGDSILITPTFTPSDATNKKVSWLSSQPLVASVSQTGIVTAHQAGTTTITCTTQDGGFEDSCIVTVKKTQYTISTSSTNGTITGGGTFEEGTQIILSAIPDQHYHFANWDDGNTDNPRTITVTCDDTYTALFALNQYSVYALPCDTNMGSVTGGGEYAYNTSATLTAIPEDDYEFLMWDDGNTDNPRTFLVTEDVTLIASFVPTTELDDISVDEHIRKFIRDNQLYILRDGKTYNAQGGEVK